MTFEATFNNGYCGCEIVEYIEATNMQEAEAKAEDMLLDYGMEYQRAAEGYDDETDEWIDPTAAGYYWAGVTYCVEVADNDEDE